MRIAIPTVQVPYTTGGAETRASALKGVASSPASDRIRVPSFGTEKELWHYMIEGLWS